MLHHPGERRDGARIVVDVGPGHAQHDVDVRLIEWYLDAESRADRHELIAVGLGARLRLAGGRWCAALS